MRRQRLVQKIVAEMDEEEVISQDIDLILYSGEEQFDLRSLGMLFEHYDVGEFPVHKQDNYISYINLQTEFEGRHVTIVAPWALKPSLPEGELIPVRGDIYGAIRGFCLNPGIDYEATDGPETIDQPHLYLAIEATKEDLTTLFLVPASQIEAYELEDLAV